MTAITTATAVTPTTPTLQTAAYRVRRLGRRGGIAVRPVRVPIDGMEGPGSITRLKAWAKSLLTEKGVYVVECLYSDYRYHTLARLRVTRPK